MSGKMKTRGILCSVRNPTLKRMGDCRGRPPRRNRGRAHVASESLSSVVLFIPALRRWAFWKDSSHFEIVFLVHLSLFTLRARPAPPM